MTAGQQLASRVSVKAKELGEKPDFIVERVQFKKTPKLSVVIPYMQINEDKPAMLASTIDSFTGADEIIVVINWRGGYAKPINAGLAQASGDYLLVMNDDLTWDGGSLKRLQDENNVTSPMVNGKSQPFWGCTFCIPRWVYDKVGGLWEGYRISYFDDADFYNTLVKNNINSRCVESVRVETKGGQTLDRFPDRNEFFEENKNKFIERWGKLPEF